LTKYRKKKLKNYFFPKERIRRKIEKRNGKMFERSAHKDEYFRE